ncbi:hypothetical protein [Dactylosporangium darangshiense]|uniref:hypothetical protein n=1 Tax=Dactylosporangium darangshiense TaxID=579108 RepID=UPI00362A1455
MIILGLILFLVGLFLHVGIIETIGIVLLIVGAVLWILGAMGRPWPVAATTGDAGSPASQAVHLHRKQFTCVRTSDVFWPARPSDRAGRPAVPPGG